MIVKVLMEHFIFIPILIFGCCSLFGCWERGTGTLRGFFFYPFVFVFVFFFFVK